MSDVEQAQDPGAASRSEGLRAQVHGWFTSTGAPPAWGLVAYMVCGLVAGAALTGLLPDFRGTLLGALAGVIVAAAGSAGPSGISRRVALIAAASGFLLMTVAFATGAHPVWAALAMAAVALLTSFGAAAGPLGSVLGSCSRSPTCSSRRWPVSRISTSSFLRAGRRQTSQRAASAGCSSSSSAPPGAGEASRTRLRRPLRHSPSRRCGSPCEASTSTLATVSGGPFRWPS
jgi:hypothetical protein